MSLRRQLTLSLVTILVLFAINVGTHFWGSYARNESMAAYRNSVNAAQLSTEIEQLLEDQRQQVLILATLRDNTEDQLEDTELLQAETAIDTINATIKRLGSLSRGVTELDFEQLWESSSTLLENWTTFYRNYNNPAFNEDMDDPLPFLEVGQRLQALEARQAFIASQRANIIDRTIELTDRITVIGFFASIFLTAILGYYLVSYTNRSLKRLKKGTERIGSGDLNYRIDNIDDTGELGDLAAAFNDMSDKLRNAIYDVRKARDAADEASATKSIFLANVSHELRTPLNAIIGYSEMLQDELGDTAEVNKQQFQQDLGTIMSSGQQLLSLINDILDLSKIETGKMSLHCEAFNPADIIRQSCDVLSPLLRKSGNELRTDKIKALPEFYSDAAKFRQIMTNLLSNANKFTDRGIIRIVAEEVAGRPGWVTFTVQDTGIGMSDDQLNKVFDAFIQADSSTSANYGGTGLGLAICKNYSELMGGTIIVRSQPGAGSIFTVTLPTDPRSTHGAA